MPHAAAMGQMSLAARALTSQLFSRAGRSAPRRRRRAAAAAAPRRRKRAKPGARKGRARLIKGSAAARRHMARLRRMRRR